MNEKVLEKIPDLFLVLAACVIAMQLIGVVLVRNPTQNEAEERDQKEILISDDEEEHKEEGTALLPKRATNYKRS